jgi:hypothetical protein
LVPKYLRTFVVLGIGFKDLKVDYNNIRVKTNDGDDEIL